ncbi:host attachment family protein [Sphingopyxis terrae]|uniref:Protein required for attachment to host cells n=1 Tax=Sphingopyxis terrae subsp. ummariensis TaxID=429001 RepID=A0A1Y6FSS6_9SPHN|nr:host attachment family protein [Sphingopyxis terrae]PCF91346.1 host attachment protein [Sphingopyxis terrae subsp. ummariensis]SMQ76521.1 Protein required for attachment to host cells [Sphingopyxis terrae subsp. ummariensis]
MSIPHNGLVLVADGRKVLFLRNHGDDTRLDLRVEAHDERSDAPNRDLKSDAPGLTAQRGGHGRPAMDETDFHQQEEDRWAAEAAAALDRKILDHEAERVAIIAPPRTLGELRKRWHKESARCVVVEIAKEMTGRPVADIEALLADTGKPPA